MSTLKVIGSFAILVALGMGLSIGQAQPVTSLVETCATWASCPENNPPPGPPPGGGTDQLLANGQPVKAGDSVRVSPGEKVNWEALCGFAASRILFMAFAAAFPHSGDHVDAQLNLIALGIAHLCVKHYGTLPALQPDKSLIAVPAAPPPADPL